MDAVNKFTSLMVPVVECNSREVLLFSWRLEFTYAVENGDSKSGLVVIMKRLIMNVRQLCRNMNLFD